MGWSFWGQHSVIAPWKSFKVYIVSKPLFQIAFTATLFYEIYVKQSTEKPECSKYVHIYIIQKILNTSNHEWIPLKKRTAIFSFVPNIHHYVVGEYYRFISPLKSLYEGISRELLNINVPSQCPQGWSQNTQEKNISKCPQYGN